MTAPAPGDRGGSNPGDDAEPGAGLGVLQAEHDLQHAHRAGEVDDHDWACFAAQQADPT